MIAYEELGLPDAAARLERSLPDGCESAPAIADDGSYVTLYRDGDSVTAILGRQADYNAGWVEEQDTHTGEGWPHYFVGFLSAFGPYKVSSHEDL